MFTERLVVAGRLAAVLAWLLVAACSGAPAAGALPAPRSAATATADPCAAPEASQFDFYIGTWNMSWTEFSPTQLTGADVIIKNGCELDELLTAPEFLGTTSYRATSVTAWDPARARWIQQYRDNGGQKTFVGSFQDGRMVLISNSPVKQRLTWRDITANGFKWDFETSPDGGTTWNQQATIDYTRA